MVICSRIRSICCCVRYIPAAVAIPAIGSSGTHERFRRKLLGWEAETLLRFSAPYAHPDCRWHYLASCPLCTTRLPVALPCLLPSPPPLCSTLLRDHNWALRCGA